MQTRPGLVALYDIQPGNQAGLFLQPRITNFDEIFGRVQCVTVNIANSVNRNWYTTKNKLT